MERKVALPAMSDADAIVDAHRSGDDVPLDQLLKLVNEGDQKALKTFRKVYDVVADLMGDVDHIQHNMERWVLEQLFRGVDRRIVGKEVFERDIERLKAELAGDNPTPIERLLINRVAVDYLALAEAEGRLSHPGDMAMEWRDYHLRRIDRAHRRYIRSLKALAQTQRLLTPVVQLNVGGQQINLATS